MRITTLSGLVAVLGMATATACMPAPPPAIDPGQPAAVAPQLPAPAAVIEPAAPANVLATRIVFPAGTLSILESSLHTQAVGDPIHLTEADFARLQVVLGGQTIAGSRIHFGAPQWEANGQYSVAMTIDGAAGTVGQDIRVGLPNRRLSLIGSTDSKTPVIEISLQTTARALLRNALGKPDSQPSDEAINAVVERLATAITTLVNGDPFDATPVVFAIDRLTKAIASGADARGQMLALSPPASTGGGGGGPTATPTPYEVHSDLTIADGTDDPYMEDVTP